MRILRLIFLCLPVICSSLWLTFAYADDDTLSPDEQLRLFYGKDDRIKIKDVGDWPWQAIGQIETESGNLCTATLIAPHLVLTAGHCVLAPPGKLDRPVALRFVSRNHKWRYEITQLKALVNMRLGKRLKPDGDGWVVPSSAATQDYALIRIDSDDLPPLRPIPLWKGDVSQLNEALKATGRHVTQAGYPQDFLDDLYSHENCLITGWAQKGVFNHQCDTLPGDSGSPLLLKDASGLWSLVAIQSSAPAPENRYRADNRAVSATAFNDELKALLQQPVDSGEK